MRNPYKVEGPAVISFSGGRTSGFMLRKIVDAHDGRLPDDVRTLFANTGLEDPRTLDFVEECSSRWGVPITWVEYRRKTENGKSHEIVNHATASRDGGPYSALIDDRKYLPNPFARFCTVELKIRVMHRVIRSWGWSEWDSCIGIRADEPRRVARVRSRGQSNETPDETPVMPLVEAGASVGDVLRFWNEQPFDLGLSVDASGVSALGNCSLCFLKKRSRIISLIRQDPSRADWWIEQEEKVTRIGSARLASGAMFRTDRESYATMKRQALEQAEMFAFEGDDLDDCNCTD